MSNVSAKYFSLDFKCIKLFLFKVFAVFILFKFLFFLCVCQNQIWQILQKSIFMLPKWNDLIWAAENKFYLAFYLPNA